MSGCTCCCQCVCPLHACSLVTRIHPRSNECKNGVTCQICALRLLLRKHARCCLNVQGPKLLWASKTHGWNRIGRGPNLTPPACHCPAALCPLQLPSSVYPVSTAAAGCERAPRRSSRPPRWRHAAASAAHAVHRPREGSGRLQGGGGGGSAVQTRINGRAKFDAQANSMWARAGCRCLRGGRGGSFQGGD